MAQKTVAYTAGVTPGSYTSADITVDNQGLITTVASGGGGTTGNWQPSDYVAGGLVWTFDPFFSNTNSSPSTGTLFGVRIKLPFAISVSNISFNMVTNSGTFTADRNFVALYQNNALLAQSADQTATWQGSGTGIKTTALTGAPFVVSGSVDVVVMQGVSAGTVNLSAFSNAVTGSSVNMGMSAPNFRSFARNVTALPADLNSTISDRSLLMILS